MGKGFETELQRAARMLQSAEELSEYLKHDYNKEVSSTSKLSVTTGVKLSFMAETMRRDIAKKAKETMKAELKADIVEQQQAYEEAKYYKKG